LDIGSNKPPPKTCARRFAKSKRGIASEAHYFQLTSRELEVLQRVAEGDTNKETAVESGLSVKTVEKYRENIMRKLNIHDTVGLIGYASSTGLVDCSAW